MSVKTLTNIYRCAAGSILAASFSNSNTHRNTGCCRQWWTQPSPQAKISRGGAASRKQYPSSRISTTWPMSAPCRYCWARGIKAWNITRPDSGTAASSWTPTCSTLTMEHYKPPLALLWTCLKSNCDLQKCLFAQTLFIFTDLQNLCAIYV